MKYSQIVEQNTLLGEKLNTSPYSIRILSNIMVHQSKEIAEFILRSEGVNALVTFGDYDNIVQDSSKCEKNDAVIIFWELCNLTDGFEYKTGILNEEMLDELFVKVTAEVNIVVNNLRSVPLVLINRFSASIFEEYSVNGSHLEKMAKRLNEFLEEQKPKNIQLVDIEKIFASISYDKAFDLRYYYLSKTLYTIDCYLTYFEFVKPIFLAVHGKMKKALIFDCDNTLWKGILGEDGFEGIMIYKEIQYIAKALSKQGVILGLCSKNNPADVDEVLSRHKDMILKNEDIVIKKVNWENKSSNLKAMAQELNISLDSFVFLDDSDFEVNLIKEELPMVKVYQIPSKKDAYIRLMKKISMLFYNPAQTNEDLQKLQMYRSQTLRTKEKEQIGNIQEYLRGLGLEITYRIDDIDDVVRLAQMTQKTNQFNVTTKRYTQTQIEMFIQSPEYMVVAADVKDKFGDNGLVAMFILHSGQLIELDTFLMSCRVLGRDIEYKLMDILVEVLLQKKITSLHAMYIKTPKNEQVSDLFDRLGFEVLKQDEVIKYYILELDHYRASDIDYIGVKYGR